MLEIEMKFPVSDFAASLRFYTETLGFKVDWGGEPGSRIGGISRDAGRLMLSQSGPPFASQVWIGVENITPLYEHLKKQFAQSEILLNCLVDLPRFAGHQVDGNSHHLVFNHFQSRC